MASNGSVSFTFFFFLTYVFQIIIYTTVYTQCWDGRWTAFLGECILGHFRPCNSEVVKVYLLTTRFSNPVFCAMDNTCIETQHICQYFQTFWDMHLPNSSVEESLVVSHLHMQDIYIHALYRSAEERSWYCSYSGWTTTLAVNVYYRLTHWCGC